MLIRLTLKAETVKVAKCGFSKFLISEPGVSFETRIITSSRKESTLLIYLNESLQFKEDAVEPSQLLL